MMMPESGGFEKSFWQDRRVFVTGATGLVGGWLIRRLLEAEADVVCLIRDWTPQSELYRSRMIDRVTVLSGGRGFMRNASKAISNPQIQPSAM